MGGGALKLETTIIKKMPIPFQLLKRKSLELDKIAITLETKFSEQQLLEKGKEIDSAIFSKNVAEQVKKNLEEYLRNRKARKSNRDISNSKRLHENMIEKNIN